MLRSSSRRATTATALALLTCMGFTALADARPAHVKGSRVLDAQGHELKVRGVTWGGTRFVPVEATATLGAPDITSAARDRCIDPGDTTCHHFVAHGGQCRRLAAAGPEMHHLDRGFGQRRGCAHQHYGGYRHSQH